MKNPVIADNKPVKVSLGKGQEYHFCTCGRSKSQPFCDGSHAGTGFTPRVIVSDKEQEAWLCACKHTSNPPFCDGTHKRFSDEQVGTEGPGVEADADAMPKPRATPEEPTLEFIHRLAAEGLDAFGRHGPMGAMGVPRARLPAWDDIQIMVAQLQRKPLMEDVDVDTRLVIGPQSRRPLELKIPLLVSDMSFGSLSAEAKIALAKGAEAAGTGICSGEGGMLPEEQAANSRYFYQLASAKFGFREELLTKVQAFHFKGGQGAKTGTGGHLPAAKNVGRIAEVRGLPEGTPAISPPTFADLHTPADFKRFGDRVRDITGGIPVGFKVSANHIEHDIEFALQGGADYLILDGRGGGLRVPSDFVKALALGADGIALSNSAMQAIGCVAARICNTNNCPAGIATQKPELRRRLDVEAAAARLARFFEAAVTLMQVMARACGHDRLSGFRRDDLASFDPVLAQLAGIAFAGFDPARGPLE